MADVPLTDDSSDHDDVALGRLLDEVAERAKHGEDLNIDAIIRDHPDLAAEIRLLWPTLQAVEALGRSSSDALRFGNATPWSLPTGTLGDFRLIRELGRGGMGIVYEAQQISLDRPVALKVLPLAALLSETQMQRFRNEARAAAMLHHPHIVGVYTVGCERGIHYYAMELVRGRTLAELIRERRIAASDSTMLEDGGSRQSVRVSQSAETPRQAITSVGTSRSDFRHIANLGMQAAQALDYAHQQGVVHRDIKPSNLIVDGHGCLRITDFGLAHVAGGHDLTLTGDIVGTLRYMSPEQASGVPAVDPRGDIYSLGVTLYELLTSRPAFDAADRRQLLRDIINRSPPELRHAVRGIPQDLATIVEKAMAKEPGDRYSTGQDLADDLSRFLSRQPIRARRAGPIRRLVRWAQRNVVTAMLAAAVLISLSVGTLVSSWQWHQARERADRLLRSLYRSDLNAAQQAWEEHDVHRTRELISQYVPRPGEEDLRGFEWFYLSRLCRRFDQVKSLTLPADPPEAVGGSALSISDNNLLAMTLQPGKSFTLWNLDNLALREDIPYHNEDLRGRDALADRQRFFLYPFAAISRDARWLAGSGRGNGSLPSEHLVMLDRRTGAVQRSERHLGGIHAAAFSSDGRWLATAGNDGQVRILDPVTARQIKAYHHDLPPVWSVAFSPDGQYVASGGGELGVRLWETQTDESFVLEGHLASPSTTDGVLAVAFSPDGELLASGGEDRTVRVWSMSDRRQLAVLFGHTQEVRSVAFSADATLLASGSRDQSIRIWEVATSHPLAVLKGHNDIVQSVGFSPTSNRLVSWGASRTLRVWDNNILRDPDVQYVEGPVQDVAISADARIVAAASRDSKTIHIWKFDSADRPPTSTKLTTQSEVDGLTILAPHRLAITRRDGLIEIWDVGRQAIETTLELHERAEQHYQPASATAAGPYLVIGGNQGTVEVRNVTNGEQFRLEIGGPSGVEVAIGRDGRTLVAADHAGKVTVWDLATRQLSCTLDHGESLNAVAISGDGKLVATSGEVIHVWRFSNDTRHPLLSFRGSRAHAQLAFLDQRTLVSASGDGTLRIWDLEQGGLRFTLTGHQGAVWYLDASADGRTVVTGSWDGSVRLWRAPVQTR